MVYRKGTGKTFYTRIGRHVVSCATPLKSVALAMEAWAKAITARHDLRGVLAAVVAGELSFVEAYKLGEEVAAAVLATRKVLADDIDLRPSLEPFLEWRGQRTKGRTMIPFYRAQLQKVYPEPTWPRSTFTTREFSRRLDALPGITDPTRNRYRAALSAFCKYLIRVGLLDTNPARDMQAYAENPAGVHWYPEPDAQRLVMAVPMPHRVRELLMAGCGMDWSDTERLRREDIDLVARTVRCHGSKTMHRNRVIRITEAWVLPELRRALAGMLPTAKVCTGTKYAALKAHHAAVKALELAPSTLHDWRHHYAVTLLRRGEKPQVVAHQEGHGTTKLVLDRYGRFIPNLQDYLPDVATDLATTTMKEA